MKKLMNFHKEEVQLNEESGSDDGSDDDSDNKNQKVRQRGSMAEIEEAYGIVEKIEKKMTLIAHVVRGIDKRMSYNMRLLGSIIMPTAEESGGQLEDEMRTEPEKN